MDKFATFLQVLENPFLALSFRQDAQERQAILTEHGFSTQEVQEISAAVASDEENPIARIFGHEQGQYLFVIIVIDAMSAAEKVPALAK
jgi:hypothetical protein